MNDSKEDVKVFKPSIRKIRTRKDRAPPFLQSDKGENNSIPSVDSRLPHFVRGQSDIPRPDDEVLPEIIDHDFVAQDLRIEPMTDHIVVVVQKDQEWTALE